MKNQTKISSVYNLCYALRNALCIITFIFFYSPIQAQDRCQTAVDIGAGQCLTLFNGPATLDPGTGQFCEDYDNNYWYYFIASETTTEVVVIPTYCVNQGGLEMEIFQELIPCTVFDVPIACGSTFGTLPLSFTITTIPGEKYYIIIDGKRGDICDFQLNLIHGLCPNPPRACDSIPTPILAGQDSICFGQGTFTYTITNYDPNLTYYWHIPDLMEYTDLGNGSIEIDFSNDWNGGGSPLICVAAVDVNCLVAQTCKSVHNTTLGFSINPQDIRRCPHSFPLNLIDYLNLLFINALVPTPDDLRVYFYLSQEDLLNDENEVIQIDSPGDYTVFVAFARGDCIKIPLPADSAHIVTEYLDLHVETVKLCDGGTFDFQTHFEITELNGYTGWPPDSLAFFFNASDAAGNRNRIDLPYSTMAPGKYWARFNTNNGCNDTVSFDVEFHQIPVFTATNPDTICSVLGNATYNLFSTPFDFSVGDISDMTFSFYRSYTDAVADRNQSPAVINASRTYYAVATSPYGCRSEPVPIDVLFLISPYIEIFGDGELCVGDSGQILITTINSPVPWTLEIEDQHGNNFVIYSFTPSLFYDIPIFQDSEFELIRFETDEPIFCPFEYSMNVAFDVIRLPTATLEVVTGCGTETGVYFRASQGGEYNAHIHNVNSGVNYVFDGELNDAFLSIPLMNGDVLSLDSFQYDSNCWSYDTYLTPPVVIQQPLEINNISVGACDPLQSTFSFTISGGDPTSYQVLGVPGSIQPNGIDFVSAPLSTGSYDIIILDDRECDTVRLNIMIDCGCRTESGMISSNDTTLCEGVDFMVSNISDTALVPGDVIHFILSDMPAPFFGNIIVESPNGIFSFDPALMILDTDYYVTMWVGPERNGLVDTSAFCAVFSNSLKIRWVEIAEATIFNALPLCGSIVDTMVTIQFSGTGPYTYSYRVNSVVYGPFTTNMSSVEILLTGLTGNTTLELIDFRNEACPGIVAGNGQILFLENPAFRNLIYTCAPAKDSFTFQVDIFGGAPPYYITGVPGQFIPDQFFSQSLPSGFNGILQLTDVNGCVVSELPITRDCECESSTAILPAEEMHLCADSVRLLTAVVNAIIAIGDGQQFFIKDNNILDASGILKVQSSSLVQFDPGIMVYGQTYYIMPATGLLDVNGDVVLDNKCFMPSAPVAFTFYETPQLQIDRLQDTLNCLVDEIILDARTSIIPNGYVFEWVVLSGQIVSGELTLQPRIDEAGVYVLRVYHPLAGCNVEEQITIYRNEDFPSAELIGDTLLNCDFPELLIDGRMSSQGTEFIYDWITANGNYRSFPENLMAEIDRAGTYQLIVTNTNSQCRDTAEIIIDENFTRPFLQPDFIELELTCEIETIVVGIFENLLTLQDEIAWFSTTSPFTQLTPHSIEVTEPGVYQVTVRNTESKCFQVHDFVVTENVDAPILDLEESYFVDCLNDIASLEVMVLNPGSYSYQWTSTISILGDPMNNQIQANLPGFFNVDVTNNENGCRAAATTEVIALQEPIRDIEMIVDPSPCGSEDNGSVNIQNIIGGTPPFIITIDELNYTEIPLDLDGLTAGSHTLQIEDENGCSFDSIFTVLNLQNVSVDLPATIMVDEGESVHLIPSILGNIDTFIWLRNDTGLVSFNSLDPTFFPEEDFVLKLILYSPDSCQTQDEVQIFVRLFYDIYVPSAFSPNDDGINDKLVVLGPEKLDRIESFQIFDRWGSKVFERFDFVPDDDQFGWDGTVKDEESPIGVYVFKLLAHFKDGTVREISSDVSLFR